VVEVPDVDLSVILADGDFLKREGGVLVGEPVTGGGLDAEGAVDATAAAFAAGTHTNVTVTYNDAAGSISLASTATGGGGGGVLPHTSLVAVADTGYTPGVLYGTIGRPGNGVLNHAAGLCMYMPVVFAHTTAITTLAIKTGSSGPAEARFWFGVYANADGATAPGARIGSAELVLPASAGAGIKSVTGLSIPVTAGRLYWLSLTPNTAQNGSALWWCTATPTLLVIRDMGGYLAETWNQSTGYVQPPATAGGTFDAGWGPPYLLYGV
jgi:hypothetical protein